MNSKMPETPADCVDDIPLAKDYRNLVIARIDYLITQRVGEAVIAAIDQTYQATINSLTAPITASEVDKAS